MLFIAFETAPLGLVETAGFEPATSCMSSMHSNQLSYASATLYIIAHSESKSKPFFEFFSIFLNLFEFLIFHSPQKLCEYVFSSSVNRAAYGTYRAPYEPSIPRG